MDVTRHPDELVYDQGNLEHFILSRTYTDRFPGTAVWKRFFETKIQ